MGGVHAGPPGRHQDPHHGGARRLGAGGGGGACGGVGAPLCAGADPLARRDLCRGVPRHLGAGAAVLAVLRAAAVRPVARAVHRGGAGARAQCRRLWLGGGARRHPGGAARAVGGVDRAQHDAGADAPADHPAAGLRRHGAALGQPLHRAPQVDCAGVADHARRPRLPGAADEPDDDADGPDLHAGAVDLSRHLARDHHRHALARGPAWPGPGTGQGSALMETETLWSWSYVAEILPILAGAAVVTIEATLIGFALAAILGLVLAILRFAVPALAWPVAALVEFIRSTPLLIQIFFLYFVFPQFGIVLDAFTAGVLALGLHYGAYCSEVYRAGLEAVPRGQWEAAIALNLDQTTTFRDIILPQALPPIVPALGNYLVALFKETPLLSAIAVLELMQTAKILGSETFRYNEPITLVGLFFLAMSLISAAGIRLVERHLNRRSAR